MSCKCSSSDQSISDYSCLETEQDRKDDLQANVERKSLVQIAFAGNFQIVA